METHRLSYSSSNPACTEMFAGKVAIVCCHPGLSEGGFVHLAHPPRNAVSAQVGTLVTSLSTSQHTRRFSE